MKNEGLDELITRIKNQVIWEDIPTTITTGTFRRIKKYVLDLKENPRRTEVLSDPTGLRQMLEAVEPQWKFSDSELLTAVDHLAKHGFVKVLRTSTGN